MEKPKTNIIFKRETVVIEIPISFYHDIKIALKHYNNQYCIDLLNSLNKSEGEVL
jgi:hypothetical protein